MTSSSVPVCAISSTPGLNGGGVGEVDPEEALRVLHASSKITNWQGRGVAADHCFRASRRLDAA